MSRAFALLLWVVDYFLLAVGVLLVAIYLSRLVLERRLLGKYNPRAILVIKEAVNRWDEVKTEQYDSSPSETDYLLSSNESCGQR